MTKFRHDAIYPTKSPATPPPKKNKKERKEYRKEDPIEGRFGEAARCMEP